MAFLNPDTEFLSGNHEKNAQSEPFLQVILFLSGQAVPLLKFRLDRLKALSVVDALLMRVLLYRSRLIDTAHDRSPRILERLDLD